MPRSKTRLAPTHRLVDLAEVLALPEVAGVPCLVFGGWAEALLELRAPGPHRDVDLVHQGESLTTFDMGFQRQRLPEEVRAKRFPHKRASAWRGLCCEILLIQDWRARPMTWFWGDVRCSGKRRSRTPRLLPGQVTVSASFRQPIFGSTGRAIGTSNPGDGAPFRATARPRHSSA